MKKFINDAVNVVAEALRGLALAHRDILSVHEKPAFVTRAAPRKGKVALVSGGGSGHEPLHAGFVGHGMLDAACPGQVFTSPTPDQIAAAAQAVDGGRGVLLIVKNYSGDVMNFEMAAEVFSRPSATVLVQDDVAVESSTYSTSRHRVATRPAEAVADELVGAILHELAARRGEPLLLFLNGFGGTPLLELYLMFDAAARRLAKDGLTVARALVGNYVTSLEMAGCSVTLARLDDEMIRLR